MSDFLRYLWPFWGTTHCVVTTEFSGNASQDKIDMIFKFLDIQKILDDGSSKFHQKGVILINFCA